MIKIKFTISYSKEIYECSDVFIVCTLQFIYFSFFDIILKFFRLKFLILFQTTMENIQILKTAYDSSVAMAIVYYLFFYWRQLGFALKKQTYFLSIIGWILQPMRYNINVMLEILCNEFCFGNTFYSLIFQLSSMIRDAW